MTYSGTYEQEIRKEVVKALGEACKSPSDYVATEALKALQEIKGQVFDQKSS